jgi:hypothetical protein
LKLLWLASAAVKKRISGSWVDAAGGDISGVHQMEITAFATLSHHIAHLGH